MSLIPERIYSQYRNTLTKFRLVFNGEPVTFNGDQLVHTQTKTVQWMRITETLGQELADVFERIRTSYDVDVANEHELSVLSNIVGLDESVNETIVSLGLDPIEARRVLIKAKIAKNTGDGTTDSIIKAVRYITGTIHPVVVDNDDMSFSIRFDEELTDLIRVMLANFDIVPRPQGVDFTGYYEAGTLSRFGDGSRYGDGTRFNNYFGG